MSFTSFVFFIVIVSVLAIAGVALASKCIKDLTRYIDRRDWK